MTPARNHTSGAGNRTDAGRSWELGDYLDVVVRYRRLIALATISMTLLAVAVAVVQPDEYRAEAKVQVRPLPTGITGAPPVLSLDTDAAVASSSQVSEEVESELGSIPSGSLEVTPLAGTELITVAYVSEDPADAEEGANSFARAFLSTRRELVLEDLQEAEAAMEEQMLEMQRAAGDLRREIAGARAAGDRRREQRLEDGREAQITRIAIVQQRLAELQPQVTVNLVDGNLVQEATRPTSPVSPDPKRNALLGLVAGALVGLGAAFVADHLRRREETSE